MTNDDVPNDDMPNFLRPAPPEGPPFSDAALAALLAGTEPAEPTPGLQHVTDVLAALRSGPTSDELAGEASVLAEFRRGIGESALSPGPRRSRRFVPRLGARAAVAAAVVALGLGGLASAAYAGMLPAPVQRLAHDTIGAPAVPGGSPSRAHQSRMGTSAGPGAAGPTAQRWCTAYAHGTAAQRAAVRYSLIRAAGGAGQIAAYCRTAIHPASSAHSGGKGAPHGNDGQNGDHGKGASPGDQGNGASTGNQGKGASTGNQGKGASTGNQGKGVSTGDQGNSPSQGNPGTGASQGSQGKSASQGSQGKSASRGSQYGDHASHSQGKSSAQSGGSRDKHGAPHASGPSAHTTPHATGRSPRARR